MEYRVDVSEVAEIEIDQAYLWESRLSPDRAGRWHAELLEAIASLSEMPRRCPVAQESDAFDGEIRRLLVGRGNRIYRVLFTVHDPTEGDEVGFVRVLHVRHGSQQLIGQPSTNGGSQHL